MPISHTTKHGTDLIAEERKRQIKEEGWSLKHDRTHRDGELGKAAICYIAAACFPYAVAAMLAKWWPWEMKWWKPTPDNRVRMLVKAGALIAAEIDRRKAAEHEFRNNSKAAIAT